MNIWVQKSRFGLKAGRRGWHCKDYFDGKKPTEPYLSGGRRSTSNPLSLRCIRQIRPGDLIVLHQTDDESFYGLAQSDSPGLESEKGSGTFDSFYLKPAVTAFRFARPVTLTELRAAGANPECFGPKTTGRIFPLGIEDLVGLVKAASIASPEQSKALAAWLHERS